MRAARPVFRAVSLAALLLVLAAACALAQGFAPTPLPGRAVARDDVPGEDFRGVWSSDKDPSGTVQIMSFRGTMISIVATGRFEAAGYATGSTGIALAAFPGPPTSADAHVRYGVLRIERRNERTLAAHFADDLNGAPTAEETWTFRSLRPERPAQRPSPNIVVTPPDGDSPRFGEYVYVDELPEAIAKTAPVYPPAARAGGVEGQVMVQALVGKDGLVKDVRIVKSIPELDDAAVVSVRQWRFKPALAKGAPVAVWVAVPVKFSLR
jgi:protein TonB